MNDRENSANGTFLQNFLTEPPEHMPEIDLETAVNSRAWPFLEAQRLVERYAEHPPEKGYVLFETGYGPSGLPHIGTFAEVLRTSLVRHAFEKISDIPTKLIAFSDDMDGLRKIPDNIPNPEMVSQHLGKPLTAIPDPFSTHDSFGAHMNSRLQAFLDHYGFDYEFRSATECYRSGMFDAALLEALKQYDTIMKIMLPTLGAERQETYSPFMPVCPETGKVLQVPTLSTNATNGTITYRNGAGDEVETTVTGGRCKLQWKPDWGMRWRALGVDYEMHGKDLTPSVAVSTQICKAIGGTPPLTYVYEMFLDEQGAKISKSKGNGLTMEEWLRYGTPESLSVYLYNNPKKAKKLYFDVIPKSVDDYMTWLQKAEEQSEEERYTNPVWHIHQGKPPSHIVPLSFSLLLNLVSVCHTEDASVLWGFITRYAPDATPETMPLLDALVKHAIAYYDDFIKPKKQYRAPTDMERTALEDLTGRLNMSEDGMSGEDLQTLVFSVGKDHGYENLREWFQTLYEILFGQSQGPRMGSFIALYGRKETVALIRRALEGKGLAA